MPLVERRYAEALINISEQNRDIDAFQQDFQTVVDIFEKQEDFRFFLQSPEVSADAKKETLKKIFDGNIKPELLNMIMLLIDKGRIKFLPGILIEYINMADKKKNVLSMTIISTAPLNDSQVNLLKDKYRKLYNAESVKTYFEIDSNLIGGVKVKIGDEVCDGTIKGRLDSLRNLLISR